VSPAHNRISAKTTWLRGMTAIADTHEHRSQSGRSRVLASHRPSPGASACDEANKGDSLGGSESRGWAARDETRTTVQLRKRILGKE
jgi:hypothetical protein